MESKTVVNNENNVTDIEMSVDFPSSENLLNYLHKKLEKNIETLVVFIKNHFNNQKNITNKSTLGENNADILLFIDEDTLRQNGFPKCGWCPEICNDLVVVLTKLLPEFCFIL